ncbi:MAG: hypothetical protein KTR31_27595 [Myxococcales bacterium]|nr:hypothetical protein [Myxococcales bacterium]
MATLIGCSNGGTTPTETEPQVPVPGPEIVDTADWPPGDLGGLYYDYRPKTGKAALYGVFLESSPASFFNLAKCAVEGPPCLTTLPETEDEFEDIDTSREIDTELVNSRFLGWEIEFAGFVLPFKQDADTGFGYYYRDITGEPQPEGWLGAKWGGQWEDYENDQELFTGPPVELINPRAGRHIRFHNGQMVPFEWVPIGDGEITLNVNSDFGLERMYTLEDDGYFELDVDDLGIANNVEELSFTFIRWYRVQQERFGHVIEYVASSDATFTAEYFNIGNRDNLPASDRCSTAQGSTPLQSGMWWGDLGDYDASLDSSDAFCLGGGCAGGFDGIYKVEVDPKHLLQVDYNTYDDSASVYLLSDCEDELSCFVGADFDPDIDAHEFLNYFNPTDVMRRFYLVVDSSGDNCGGFGDPTPVDTYYTLDVTLDPLFPPDMYDTCAEAEKAYSIPPGNYYAEFVAYTNTLNPGAGGCTQSSLPGNEAMTPLELQPNQTVTINVRMPGGDPGIYLLYDCGNEFSCPTGRDASLDDNEIMSYTNQGVSTERLYIVVDSKDGMQPYFMSVNVF